MSFEQRKLPFGKIGFGLQQCSQLRLFAQAAEAQDRSQTRSMVISKGGIVAAESPLAAQAGVRILESGGNAVDAAIATNAMMGVVEPMMNGVGGDLFAMVYDAKATGALWIELQRLGTEGPDHRISAEAGN